jgi:hypothetical protein
VPIGRTFEEDVMRDVTRTIGSWPLGLRSVILAAGLVSASAAFAATPLDWSAVNWNPGDLKHTYTLGDADITIEISSQATGSFTVWNQTNGGPTGSTCLVASPGKDGPGQSTDFFGSQLDLGVIFEPEPPSGDMPVLIKIKFTNAGSGEFGPQKAVDSLKFEISDIDWAGGGPYTAPCNGLGSQGWRRDKVVISADDHGAAVTGFTIMPKVSQPSSTVLVIAPDTAIAEGSTQNDAVFPAPSFASAPGSDNGTVMVDFGSSAVTNVLLVYSEAAFGQPCSLVGPGCSGGIDVNPGFRGIGILGVTMRPVTLMEFTIE